MRGGGAAWCGLAWRGPTKQSWTRRTCGTAPSCWAGTCDVVRTTLPGVWSAVGSAGRPRCGVTYKIVLVREALSEDHATAAPSTSGGSTAGSLGFLNRHVGARHGPNHWLREAQWMLAWMFLHVGYVVWLIGIRRRPAGALDTGGHCAEGYVRGCMCICTGSWIWRCRRRTTPRPPGACLSARCSVTSSCVQHPVPCVGRLRGSACKRDVKETSTNRVLCSLPVLKIGGGRGSEVSSPVSDSISAMTYRCVGCTAHSLRDERAKLLSNVSQRTQHVLEAVERLRTGDTPEER